MNAHLLSLLTLALAQSSLATIVTINPTKDNTLYQAANGGISNGQGDYIFTGRTAVGILHRALLVFNVAGSVPSGAVVTDVSLFLTVSRWAGGFPPASIRTMTRDWGEGLSNASGQEGRGTAAGVGDATWTKAFHGTPGVLWTTPGGDFLPNVEATLIFPGTLGVMAFNTPQLIGRVQTWLDNPASNFGWVVTGNEEFPTTSIRFNSKQNPDAPSRPRLKITYRCPADRDNNGIVDTFDYLSFVQDFADNAPAADFNNDQVIDFFDYLDYVAAFARGC